jgi:methylmalonyl-CoA/ethylmalonyl-CoA epimerase
MVRDGGPVELPDSNFHHVGVACRDLDVEQRAFFALGYRAEGPDFDDPIQGVRGRFLVGPGPRMELLVQRGEAATLTPWLRKGVKLYHLAFEVGDTDGARRSVSAQGAKRVVDPVPAVAFGGRRIEFWMLPNLLLIEFIETKG